MIKNTLHYKKKKKLILSCISGNVKNLGLKCKSKYAVRDFYGFPEV